MFFEAAANRDRHREDLAVRDQSAGCVQPEFDDHKLGANRGSDGLVQLLERPSRVIQHSLQQIDPVADESKNVTDCDVHERKLPFANGVQQTAGFVAVAVEELDGHLNQLENIAQAKVLKVEIIQAARDGQRAFCDSVVSVRVEREGDVILVHFKPPVERDPSQVDLNVRERNASVDGRRGPEHVRKCAVFRPQIGLQL